MNIKQAVKSQYGAALAMLEHATNHCPASMWDDPTDQNRFWRVAYHVLFYTDLYLQPREEDFSPWDKHREGLYSLSRPSGEDGGPELEPYSREEILEYLAFCRGEVEAEVDALDLAAESGFHWLPFDKLELQFYNIRHIQHHTGELYDRLGSVGKIKVDWVGMVKA